MRPLDEGTRRLLKWFDQNHRDLPWRGSSDPYSVWVSEIMLQQTQVDRVVPYYNAFLRRFPTVQQLAEAPSEDVLAAWSGLGYYRRARWLHAAARQIVANGAFPATVEGWLGLPGIGPYTAAAISSIALGQKVAAVDGNIERVISRWQGVAGDPKKASVRRLLVSWTESLLDAERPGDSNQALMEIGATICRPRRPDCATCPLAVDCVALSRGETELLPERRRGREVSKTKLLAVIVEREATVLLVRRPASSDLLAGLWEVPWSEWVSPGAACEEMARRYGGEWHLEASCGWVRHSITHRDIRVEVFHGRVSNGEVVSERGEARWFPVAEIGKLAQSSLLEKILRRGRADQRVEDDG